MWCSIVHTPHISIPRCVLEESRGGIGSDRRVGSKWETKWRFDALQRRGQTCGNTVMSQIVDFLERRGVDGAGRQLSDILSFTPMDLEHRHDFIQWLFPLPQASLAVPGSPVLTDKDIEIIEASGPAQASLTQATDLMGRFYDQTDHWMTASDHNHLRITRIIKSLRLLSGDRPADRFYARILARVEATRAPVNSVTRDFWAAA